MVAQARRPTTTDPLETLAAQWWRLEPHTFAAHASGGRFAAWPHLRHIGERIAEAVVRGRGRLIISIPPRHGKSTLLSHWTPVWLLDNLPRARVILAAHGAELAAHWGRIVRNEFAHNALLTTRLSEDSQAADRWNTPDGGGMVTVGVGGGITGFGGDVILIDDPTPTWEDAMSLTHRERVKEWFNGTLYDRGEPGATIVLLMHRWHEDDLAGHLIEHHADKWDVIRLPALAEPGDPLGRGAGDALCPERYDAEALAGVRAAVGPIIWAAKYQQAPLGLGSGRVYHAFLPERNEDKALSLVPGLPLQASIDFNYNPGMHLIAGQYDAAADMLTAVHEVHGPYMRLTPCLEAFIKLADRIGGGRFPWPELHVFGDPAGHQNRAETTETAWQQVQNKLGAWMDAHGKPMRMKVGRAQFPVRTRVETFNEALCDATGAVHYRVHPQQCPRLLEDFKRLKADAQGLVDKRDESLSHASEAEANRVCWLRPIRRAVRQAGEVILMS